jgi:hypothetical protein
MQMRPTSLVKLVDLDRELVLASFRCRLPPELLFIGFFNGTGAANSNYCSQDLGVMKAPTPVPSSLELASCWHFIV